MKKIIVLPAISILLLTSCIPGDVNPNGQQYKNQSYGSHAQQTMDVYLPKSRSSSSTPVVVFIHGGGWSAGDKSNYDSWNIFTTLNNEGYAVVNINYRLVTDNSFRHPTQLNDIDSALAFVHKKASGWEIDDTRMVLLGGSAGGHLSLQYAYTRNTNNKVKAVVDFFGPTDLSHFSITGNTSVVGVAQAYVGVPYTGNEQKWREASPLYHISGAVPTMILQGGTDYLVLPVQSQMLRDSLNARGIANEYIYYPNEGHGWDGKEFEESKTKFVQWIKTQMPR